MEEAGRRRRFYIETGDIADGTGGEITISVKGYDTPIRLDALRVTELRRATEE